MNLFVDERFMKIYEFTKQNETKRNIRQFK